MILLLPNLSFGSVAYMSTSNTLLSLILFTIGAALLIDWLFLKNFGSEMRSIFFPKDKQPDFIAPEESYKKIDKGFTIALKGAPEKNEIAREITHFSLQPTDYRGILPIPKMMVSEGDHVKAGQPLFYDKDHPETMFVSPVSGTIKEIRRGDKRAITDVVIEKDSETDFLSIDKIDKSASRDEFITFLEKSGGLPLFVQRPYGILPDKSNLPSRIYISTFDSSPLTLPLTQLLKTEDYDFIQEAINYLHLLTDEVHIGLDAKAEEMPAFAELENCHKHWFAGKHPYGNVGIQIHNTQPMGMEEIVWTIDPQNLVVLGKLLKLGVYDSRRYYTLGGDVQKPGYVYTFAGPNMGELLGNEASSDKNDRYVSGSVLSGQKRNADQFVSAHTNKVSVIPEGDDYEMFGWLIPTKMRPSMSHTYLNYLFPGEPLSANTNTHGEKRAFVMTGQYEKVLPVDTYPLPLFKAIITNDFETMRGLGIHELLEEDVALCEFACTSKQPLQKILREGLDYVQSQM